MDQVDAVNVRRVQLPAIIIIIIVVAMATTSLADSVGNYHDVRTIGGPPATSRSLAEHFQAWETAVAACGSNTTTASPRIQPLVFVAAAGGGIRAAYWTERALLELTGRASGDSDAQARCMHDSVFLVSAVSGGGVGSALWTLRAHGYNQGAAPYTTAIAGQDGLAGISAAWLFRDTARALSAVDFVWPDRAAVMEQSWRDSLSPSGVDVDQPLLTVGSAWKPLLLLNGTDLQTGCRVVISPIGPANPPELPRHCVDAGVRGTDLPAAYFATEFLDTAQCSPPARHNLSVATAALLAARFPYVTPTGSMYACSNNESPTAKTKVVRIQIGDGGYLENSGLQAALQAWRAIQPLVAAHNREVLDPQTEPSTLPGTVIMPVVVSVGSGYRSLAVISAPNRENEFVAPIASRDIAKKGLDAPRLEAEVRAEFARPVPGSDDSVPGLEVRFIDIAPSSRPEVTAPLGWTLSPLTQQTLDRQLDDQVREGTGLKLLRTLMTGTTSAAVLAPATTPGTFP